MTKQEYLNISTIRENQMKNPLQYKNINKFFEPQTKRYHQPVLFVPPVSSAWYSCRFLNMWKAASVLSALSLSKP